MEAITRVCLWIAVTFFLSISSAHAGFGTGFSNEQPTIEDASALRSTVRALKIDIPFASQDEVAQWESKSPKYRILAGKGKGNKSKKTKKKGSQDKSARKKSKKTGKSKGKRDRSRADSSKHDRLRRGKGDNMSSIGNSNTLSKSGSGNVVANGGGEEETDGGGDSMSFQIVSSM